MHNLKKIYKLWCKGNKTEYIDANKLANARRDV